MTIGPAPMIRIEEMSVRLGMSLGDRCALGTKKGRALCASFRRRRGLRPRARAALRPESAGREGHCRLAQHLKSPSFSRRAHHFTQHSFVPPARFCARGLTFLLRSPEWGGGGAPKELTGGFARTPGAAST